MFKFRGQLEDSGDWVVGSYIEAGGYHTIMTIQGKFYHVPTESLAVSFGKLDSNDQEIFASFPIDGVMTKGGDVVEVEYGKAHTIEGQYDVRFCTRYCAFMAYHKVREDIIYELSDFGDNEITIIGKQGGNQ